MYIGLANMIPSNEFNHIGGVMDSVLASSAVNIVLQLLIYDGQFTVFSIVK
jgi:hypothetical protein